MTPLMKLFGKDPELEKLPQELRPLVDQMRQARTAYEAAVARGESTVGQLGRLAEPAEQAEQHLRRLEERMDDLQAVVSRLSDIERGAAKLEETQRDVREELDGTKNIADRVRDELDEMRDPVAQILELKEELPKILEWAGHLEQLQARSTEFETQMDEIAERFGKVQTEHGEIASTSTDAQARLETLEESQGDAGERMESLAEQLRELESAAAPLQQLVADLPGAKRELGTLQTVSEYVSRKVTTIEGQRDAVERATKRAEHFADLVAQIDRQLQEQQTTASHLGKLKDNVDELKQLHVSVLERTEDVQEHLRAVEAKDREGREQFASLRDDMEKSLGQVRFERDGLETVNERVSQLREVTSRLEERLPEVEDARTAITETTEGAEQLARRTQEVAEQLAGIETDAATVQAVRSDVEQLQEAVRDLTSKLDEFAEPSVAAIDAAETRVEGLHDSVAALEGRSESLEAYAERLIELDRTLSSRETAVGQVLEQLDEAGKMRREIAVVSDDLKQESETLHQQLASTTLAGERAEQLMREIDARTQHFEAAFAQIDRIEEKLAESAVAEERVARSLELTSDRQTAADTLRSDLTRMFEVADATHERVRHVAALQQEIQDRRASLEAVMAQVRELDGQGEMLTEREQEFAEAERRLSRLDALLADAQSTLDTVLEQREFLEQVVKTAGALSLQTVQAEEVLNALRNEREAGENPPG